MHGRLHTVLSGSQYFSSVTKKGIGMYHICIAISCVHNTVQWIQILLKTYIIYTEYIIPHRSFECVGGKEAET